MAQNTSKESTAACKAHNAITELIFSCKFTREEIETLREARAKIYGVMLQLKSRK